MTTEPTWRKSTRSNGSANCVEIAFLGDGNVGVRDSKDGGRGPILRFEAGVWDAFVEGIRAGGFRRP